MALFPLFRRPVQESQILLERKFLPKQFFILSIVFLLLHFLFCLDLSGILITHKDSSKLINAIVCLTFSVSALYGYGHLNLKNYVVLESSRIKVASLRFAVANLLFFLPLNAFIFNTNLDGKFFIKIPIYALIIGLFFGYRLNYIRKIYEKLNPENI